MARKLTPTQNKLYNSYHVPGCGPMTTVKLNVVFMSGAHTYEHAKGQFDTAWELKELGQPFIIEAARRATDEERVMFNLKKDKVVDVVSLAEQEYEIIHKHESDEQIAFYRKNGTIAVVVGETIVCRVCKQVYPKRKKDNICSICTKEEK